MKKSISTIVILFSLFSVVLNSCDEDTGDPEPIITEVSGTYQLVMGGLTVAEGTSTTNITMNDNTANLGGTGSELVVTITNVPDSIEGTIEINESSDVEGENCQVTISGTNLIKDGVDEIYWGISGTVTRTTATKISFTGSCKEDAEGTITHNFGGHIESEAYKPN